MSRADQRRQGQSQSFPRVSGDEPGDYLTNRKVIKFSPRERG